MPTIQNRTSRVRSSATWLATSLLFAVGCGTTEVAFDGQDAAPLPEEGAAGSRGVVGDAHVEVVDATPDSSTDKDADVERASPGVTRQEAGGSDAQLGVRDAAVEARAGDAAALDPCGYPPDETSDPLLSRTRVSGYGFLNFVVSPKNEIVELHTTLTVPAKPPPTGTLFLWPGLQPAAGARNYLPIDNGVLQPVLTWGPTCAPRSPSNSYASWWISPQYVNTFGRYSGYTGCLGAAGLSVDVGDKIDLRMALNGTVWRQVVTSLKTSAVASFDIDMLGQAQNYAEFLIEIAGQRPITDVVFTSTSFTMASPEPTACQPNHRGAADDYATPRVSSDGRTCCVARIVLRALGVAPTTTP